MPRIIRNLTEILTPMKKLDSILQHKLLFNSTKQRVPINTFQIDYASVIQPVEWNAAQNNPISQMAHQWYLSQNFWKAGTA